jgi:hypothetical protein
MALNLVRADRNPTAAGRARRLTAVVTEPCTRGAQVTVTFGREDLLVLEGAEG